MRGAVVVAGFGPVAVVVARVAVVVVRVAVVVVVVLTRGWV